MDDLDAIDHQLEREAQAQGSAVALGSAKPSSKSDARWRIHRRERHGRGGFAGVADDEYKMATTSNGRGTNRAGGGWARVVRRELIGKPGPDPCAFHVRHFEVAPGGFSSCERHQHIHAVIGERGIGVALIEGQTIPILPGDVLYIGPNTPHQLRCADGSHEPFGFFCIVDANRDKPVALDEKSLQPVR